MLNKVLLWILPLPPPTLALIFSCDIYFIRSFVPIYVLLVSTAYVQVHIETLEHGVD